MGFMYRHELPDNLLVHLPFAKSKAHQSNVVREMRHPQQQQQQQQQQQNYPAMDRGPHPLSSIQKNANKRRFSDEQIKFLEFMFESESRPESRTKQQLANELGLEPRQVSIWFQNRRARLRTKKIEKEYSILKASYDVLASSFESLKRERQSLIIQLQNLKNRPVRQHGSRNCGSQLCGFENKDTDSESKEKPSSQLDGNGRDENRPSSDNNSRNTVNTMEEIEILNQTEQTDNLSQWWEFWS